MVILETAVVGAAGYGLYKGGDAAVRKGKQTKREFKQEQNRRTQRNELASKTKERKERLARITDMRNNNNNNNGGKESSSTSSTSISLSNWLPSSSSLSSSSSRQATTTTKSSAPPIITAKTKSTSDVNDRYQSVLKKLDEKPKKEKKGGIMGMFGKKK